METFPGRVLHAHSFKDAAEFKGDVCLEEVYIFSQNSILIRP